MYQNIDWSKKCLKSIYHNSEEEEFYIKVFNVINTTPTGFTGCTEDCFYCQCFEGQNYRIDKSYLRCSLIGILYKIVDIPVHFKSRQLSIFDFGVEVF